MKALSNSVRLIGNLGKDPVVRTFANGNMLANITLATKSYSKDKEGNRVEETDWHNLVIWGKQAELVSKLLKKGSQVAIEGSLKSRKYTDQHGQFRYVTEVIVHDFQILSKKAD